MRIWLRTTRATWREASYQKLQSASQIRRQQLIGDTRFKSQLTALLCADDVSALSSRILFRRTEKPAYRHIERIGDHPQCRDRRHRKPPLNLAEITNA